MRVPVIVVGLLLGASAPVLAQSGLSGALDRQELQRAVQQSEQRRETELQRRDLQGQLDQGRLQQLIERQQTLRQAPVPCPFARPATGC